VTQQFRLRRFIASRISSRRHDVGRVSWTSGRHGPWNRPRRRHSSSPSWQRSRRYGELNRGRCAGQCRPSRGRKRMPLRQFAHGPYSSCTLIEIPSQPSSPCSETPANLASGRTWQHSADPFGLGCRNEDGAIRPVNVFTAHREDFIRPHAGILHDDQNVTQRLTGILQTRSFPCGQTWRVRIMSIYKQKGSPLCRLLRSPRALYQICAARTVRGCCWARGRREA
jgi:hypothetical protein